MPRMSRWDEGLLPHEQARLSHDVDGSGMAQHDAAEKTATTVVVAQVGDDATPQWLKACDQEGDDRRLQRPHIFKQHPNNTN